MFSIFSLEERKSDSESCLPCDLLIPIINAVKRHDTRLDKVSTLKTKKNPVDDRIVGIDVDQNKRAWSGPSLGRPELFDLAFR